MNAPVVREGIPIAEQDAVKADPKHYGVAAEDERVRVLRIHYGVGEKSVMHAHPATVVIALTDNRARFTDDADETADLEMKAGEVLLLPATTHLPENLGEQPMEAIAIEFKSQRRVTCQCPTANLATAPWILLTFVDLLL